MYVTVVLSPLLRRPRASLSDTLLWARANALGNLWLEPFDKPQISQEVYVGVVEGVFATGVQLAPMAPLPNTAEAQEPEIGAPLPYVDAAALHPLEYAYARSQEGQ